VVIATAQEGTATVQPEIILDGPGIAPGTVFAKGTFSSFRLTAPLPEGGELHRSPFQDNGNNSDGYYSIAFTNLTSGALVSPSDPNGGLIASGQTVTGAMSSNSDMDAYQFEGSLNDRIVVTASGIRATARAVPLPPGRRWTRASFLGDGSLNPRPRGLPLETVGTGTYTILVGDYGMNNYGSYALSFARIPGEATSPVRHRRRRPRLGGDESRCLSLPRHRHPTSSSFQAEPGRSGRDHDGQPLRQQRSSPESISTPRTDGCASRPSNVGAAFRHLLDTVVAAGGNLHHPRERQRLNSEGWYSDLACQGPGDRDLRRETATAERLHRAKQSLGYLTNQVDSDIYQFEAQSGELAILTSAENTGGVQPDIRLYAPDGFLRCAGDRREGFAVAGAATPRPERDLHRGRERLQSRCRGVVRDLARQDPGGGHLCRRRRWRDDHVRGDEGRRSHLSGRHRPVLVPRHRRKHDRALGLFLVDRTRSPSLFSCRESGAILTPGDSSDKDELAVARDRHLYGGGQRRPD